VIRSSDKFLQFGRLVKKREDDIVLSIKYKLCVSVPQVSDMLQLVGTNHEPSKNARQAEAYRTPAAQRHRDTEKDRLDTD